MNLHVPKTRPGDYMNPWTLFALALLAIVYGGSYLVASLTGGTDDLRLTRFGMSLPLTMYAGVWLVVGFTSLAGMYSRRVFKLGYSSLTALMAIWSLINLGVYVFGDFTVIGSVVASAVWGALTVCTYTLSIAEQTAIKVHDQGVEQATEAVDDLVDDIRKNEQGAE